MSKPLFIAISGKKGSGKDEFARLLKRQLEDPIVRVGVEITHFADPLKEICIKLFGLDPKLVYGSNADKEKPTTVKWNGFPFEVRVKYSNQVQMVPNDIQDNDPWDEHEEKVPRTGAMTHRELLQVMGTDIFRERVYQQIWAEYPFKQRYHDDTLVVFIADCRFPNEVEETIKNDGLVIRISRDTGHNDNHPSETALDNYDWNKPNHLIINNNGTLRELEDKAANIASVILDFKRDT